MLLDWNLRRQSARLWKSTVRSCHARCAAPQASPAPSAGTWTPGAAPALLRPGRRLAPAPEAEGGRPVARPLLPWELRAAQSHQARRPEEAQQPPSGPSREASNHAAAPATARLPTQPRLKRVSHARLSSPGSGSGSAVVTEAKGRRVHPCPCVVGLVLMRVDRVVHHRPAPATSVQGQRHGPVAAAVQGGAAHERSPVEGETEHRLRPVGDALGQGVEHPQRRAGEAERHGGGRPGC
eukprot:scaffold38264_cov61-Phaeocystis_antarctica.AAC.6